MRRIRATGILSSAVGRRWPPPLLDLEVTLAPAHRSRDEIFHCLAPRPEGAAAIALQLQKQEYPSHAFSASLRPLNTVLSPAVAVELAPGENGIDDLTSASYQQRAAAAIADAVASVHERLEGPSGDRVIGSSGNLKSEAFDLRSPDGPITRSPNLARSPDLTMVNP